AAVRVETYGPGYEIVKEPNPSSPYRAQFSIAYCVAAALTEGRLGLEQFSPNRFDESGVRDASIASLLGRLQVTVQDDLSAKYPAAWPTRVEIELDNGDTLRGTADFPRGNPENPVTDRELEQKFVDLVAPRLGLGIATRGIALVDTVATCLDMATHFRELLPTDGSAGPRSS
ncbi:MAG: hypothetical protein ABI205_11235, partial [Gemmatimonadaceae bacterium]